MLQQAHSALHETLSDEEEIQDSVDYFQYVEEKVQDLTARAKQNRIIFQPARFRVQKRKLQRERQSFWRRLAP